MDIQHHKRNMARRLLPLYESTESDVIALRVLEEVTGKSYPELFISDYKLTKKEEERIESILRRLEEHEPLQYIIGEVTFGPLRLSVAPGVLIPRPETEEMCDMILRRGLLCDARRAIDIGTGSGAIALSLAIDTPQLTVDAIDVSAEALRIAEQNIIRHHLSDRVHPHLADILSRDFTPPASTYDLIVSNPPYVLSHERTGMRPHVLEHEPMSALFVPDDDPLIFYRVILDRLLGTLSRGGWVVLELNALTADDCALLCRERGLLTDVVRDMEGKQRFIFAQKR